MFSLIMHLLYTHKSLCSIYVSHFPSNSFGTHTDLEKSSFKKYNTYMNDYIQDR